MQLLRNGSPPSFPSTGTEYSGTVERAIHQIQEMGLPTPKQPLDHDGNPVAPQLQDDLTKLSSQELGKLLALVTACADYAAYIAAVSDVSRNEAQQSMDLTWARVRMEKSGTVGERDNKTNLDPRMVHSRREFLEREAVARLTAVVSKNYERDLNTLSREITRRGVEFHRS